MNETWAKLERLARARGYLFPPLPGSRVPRLNIGLVVDELMRDVEAPVPAYLSLVAGIAEERKSNGASHK